MEELRSTEVLDREIESDARKKAEKILKNADVECAKILGGVENRIKTAVEQKNAYYKAKIERFERNTTSALPLEKERYLVKFYAESSSVSLNEYLENLGEKKRLALLEKKFKKIKNSLYGRKFRAAVFGFEIEEAKKIVPLAVSFSETTFKKSGEEAAFGNRIHEGIILESEDGSVRVRLTIDQIVRELFDEYSQELAEALFGGTLPE